MQAGVSGNCEADLGERIIRGGIAMPIGFRVRKNTDKVSADLVAKYQHMPVANVSDSMSRMTAGGSRLRPMHASGQLSGPALTVKTRPGDNLMLHKAIDMAEPGDVIVCDGGGDLTNSLMGEIMLSLAMSRGVAGFVLDAAIRDLTHSRSGTCRYSQQASAIAALTKMAPVKSAMRLPSMAWSSGPAI